MSETDRFRKFLKRLRITPESCAHIDVQDYNGRVDITLDGHFYLEKIDLLRIYTSLSAGVSEIYLKIMEWYANLDFDTTIGKYMVDEIDLTKLIDLVKGFIELRMPKIECENYEPREDSNEVIKDLAIFSAKTEPKTDFGEWLKGVRKIQRDDEND